MHRPDSRLRRFVGLGALLVPYAPLVADDRPAALAETGGNPLALDAMAFLGWYWTLVLVLAGVVIVLRVFGGGLRAPARSSAGLGEDPYAMAYLAGGCSGGGCGGGGCGGGGCGG